MSKQKPNVLISACLYGKQCRYDGKIVPLKDEIFQKMKELVCFIPVCPEQDGGLPTPRPPCEIKNGKVVSNKGIDCTEAYQKGAYIALQTAFKNNVSCCLLKSKSPSCGNKQIYDGTFTKTKIAGQGIAANLLTQNGFRIFDETDLLDLYDFLLSIASNK